MYSLKIKSKRVNVNQTPQSSNIKSYGYNADLNRLTVQFNSGGTYVYYGVPKNIWKEFTKTESKGKFLHKEIKLKGYTYERIESV